MLDFTGRSECGQTHNAGFGAKNYAPRRPIGCAAHAFQYL
jgi:hypothetical protein